MIKNASKITTAFASQKLKRATNANKTNKRSSYGSKLKEQMRKEIEEQMKKKHETKPKETEKMHNPPNQLKLKQR